MSIEYSLNHADLKAFDRFCMQRPADRRTKLFRWLFTVAVIAALILFYEEIAAFLRQGFFSTMLTARDILVALAALGTVLGRRQAADALQGP